MNKQFTFQELQAIVSTLRSEKGCPWDRAQTHESIRSTTLEEAYEVNQAVTDLIKTRDPSNLKEELGDLLLQIMFHCQIAEENAEFTLEDVIDGIAAKMIRRHPHVFGRKSYSSIEEQQADWEDIKAGEHPDDISPGEELRNIPQAFPALVRSQKTAKKAMKHNLIPSSEETIFKNMLESVVALQMASADSEDKETFNRKLGEALFAITCLAARHDVSSEMALNDEIDSFISKQ
ncbi:MAG: nucleoside triphosphate pyrophosphohydrolase [Eubacterium sp.]|nr:nucleoside triphosphate pyrophosphohydrolase [Eubacterium sp.]